MTELPGGGEVFPTAGLPRLAVGAGAVWAVNPDGSISRIDLETGELVARIETEAPAWTIAAGDEGVWYLSVDAGSSVMSIDPRTNRTAQRIDLRLSSSGEWPIGAGSVWATTREQGLFWRIEPGRDPGAARSTSAPGSRPSRSARERRGRATTSTAPWRASTRTTRRDREDPGRRPAGARGRPGGAWVSVAGGSTGGPLTAPACGPVESGRRGPGRPDRLGSPAPGPGRAGIHERWRARSASCSNATGSGPGEHTVGYQSCDVSTAADRRLRVPQVRRERQRLRARAAGSWR